MYVSSSQRQRHCEWGSGTSIPNYVTVQGLSSKGGRKLRERGNRVMCEKLNGWATRNRAKLYKQSCRCDTRQDMSKTIRGRGQGKNGVGMFLIFIASQRLEVQGQLQVTTRASKKIGSRGARTCAWQRRTCRIKYKAKGDTHGIGK